MPFIKGKKSQQLVLKEVNSGVCMGGVCIIFVGSRVLVKSKGGL